MHDDRNYVFVLACWQIRNLREDETFGDGVQLDYNCFFNKNTKTDANDPWTKAVRGIKTSTNKKSSPFQGRSPFSK